MWCFGTSICTHCLHPLATPSWTRYLKPNDFKVDSKGNVQAPQKTILDMIRAFDSNTVGFCPAPQGPPGHAYLGRLHSKFIGKPEQCCERCHLVLLAGKFPLMVVLILSSDAPGDCVLQVEKSVWEPTGPDDRISSLRLVCNCDTSPCYSFAQ